MQVLIFIAGIIVTCAVMVPVLRSYKKRIRELEDKTEQSFASVSNFKGKTIKLAAAVKESADVVSRTGKNNKTSDAGQTGSMEKVESTINENARIAADIVEKTRSVAVIASKMEEDVLGGFKVLEKNVKKMGDIRKKIRGV